MRLEKLIVLCLLLCSNSFAWDDTKIKREFELLRNSAFLPEIEKIEGPQNTKKLRGRIQEENNIAQTVENLEARYFNDNRVKTQQEMIRDSIRTKNAAPKRERSR